MSNDTKKKQDFGPDELAWIDKKVENLDNASYLVAAGVGAMALRLGYTMREVFEMLLEGITPEVEDKLREKQRQLGTVITDKQEDLN